MTQNLNSYRSSMATYKYERLRQPRDIDDLGEFRLATLLRGSGEAEIHITIHKHDLYEPVQRSIGETKSDVQWFAWSYCVGDPHDKVSIVVEAPSPRDEFLGSGIEIGRLSINRSLAEALRCYRKSTVDFVFWADAVSIDQGTDEASLKEREWQVRRMYNIYGIAKQVILWLGVEAHDSDSALLSLHQLGDNIRIDWRRWEITEVRHPGINLLLQRWSSILLDPTAPEGSAVFALFERPYFERCWVIQEAQLANEDTSMVLCGHLAIFLNVFRKAVAALAIMGLGPSAPRSIAERLRMTALICARDLHDPASALSNIRRFKCYDPRDKVYGSLGLLSLARDRELALSISVDYSLSHTVDKVYKDFFRKYQERYLTLGLLVEAGLFQGSDLRPTWLPDWRSSTWFQNKRTGAATSHFETAECQYVGNDILRVVGRVAMVVDRTHLLEPVSAEPLGVAEWCYEILILMLEQLPHSDPETEVDRLSHVLCWFLVRRGKEGSQREHIRETIKMYLRYLYDCGIEEPVPSATQIRLPSDMIPEDMAITLGNCVKSMKDFRLPFLFSGDGYVGLGPPGARAGDVVAAILGCRVLMLLRPSENSGYQVVGHCSVHGLNWGEALLGPLPAPYEMIPRWESSREGRHPYYLNTKTGEGTRWDPRIDWHGLEVANLPPGRLAVAVSASPEEAKRARPDSAYLRARGIELQTFDLV